MNALSWLIYLGIIRIAVSNSSTRSTLLSDARGDFSDLIIETDDIDEIEHYLNPSKVCEVKPMGPSFPGGEVLIIFDYDNVLVEAKGTEFGFDFWFQAMTKQLLNHGFSRELTLKTLLPIYEEIQETSAQVKLVDSRMPQLIENFKQKSYPLLVLTIRPPKLIKTIFKQMNSVGINISEGNHFLRSVNPHVINYALEGSGATYQDGVLFCGRYNKGDVLQIFLRAIPHPPFRRIVFIDDKLSNLVAVERITQHNRIDFVGLRYNVTDPRGWHYHLDEQSKKLLS